MIPGSTWTSFHGIFEFLNVTINREQNDPLLGHWIVGKIEIIRNYKEVDILHADSYTQIKMIHVKTIKSIVTIDLKKNNNYVSDNQQYNRLPTNQQTNQQQSPSSEINRHHHHFQFESLMFQIVAWTWQQVLMAW